MKRAVLALLLFLWLSPAVRTQDNFYQGKTIKIIVGSAPGGGYDLWPRFMARYFSQYIPGKPEVIIQNMPGAGSLVAANYIYNVAKPGGFTLGAVIPAIYFDQLVGRKEVQFDWSQIDVAVERGEVVCWSPVVATFVGREPYVSWSKKGFVRVLIQTGKKRDPRLGDVPTIWELMDRYKTPEGSRQLVQVVITGVALGRPIISSPAIPAERLKTLRETYAKMLADPELLREASKRRWEINPLTGEELESLARQVIVQPPQVVERMKWVLGRD